MNVTLETLSQHPHWVAWREETRAGKRTKVPYSPRDGGKAESDNPSTWGSRVEAAHHAARIVSARGRGGIGRAYTGRDCPK
jgi:primase-polymerase (primpol)-like protein